MKILIIKTSSLGDIIHSFPAIEDIKKKFPNCKIDYLVDNTFLRTARLNKNIDNFLTISHREKMNKSIFLRINDLDKELNSIFKNRYYDQIIDLQGLIRTQILGARIRKITGSKQFNGYDFKSAREALFVFLYDKKIGVSKNLHAVKRMKNLVASCLDFPPEKDINFGHEINHLKRENKVVFIHGSSKKSKEYPTENWKKIARYLKNYMVDICIPVNDNEQRIFFNEINKLNNKAYKLETEDLEKIKNELAKCSFFIGVDTGFTHICSSFGMSGIFLLAKTDPIKAGPIFNHQKVIRQKSMDKIDPEEIILFLKEENFD